MIKIICRLLYFADFRWTIKTKMEQERGVGASPRDSGGAIAPKSVLLLLRAHYARRALEVVGDAWCFSMP